jgi:hypothetical protein
MKKILMTKTFSLHDGPKEFFAFFELLDIRISDLFRPPEADRASDFGFTLFFLTA